MIKALKALLWIGIAAIVAVLSFLSFKAGERRGHRLAVAGMKADTVQVIRVDTIKTVEPKYVAIHTVDTMFFPVIVRQLDTMFVPMPREQAFYRDSSYEAWVSGYRPALDSIRIYRRLERMTIHTVSTEKVKSRWGIGIQAGYGFAINDNHLLSSPYVGVGVSYNLLSW